MATNGASRSANYLMSAAQFLAATGRPLRPGVTTETVNLLLPGQIYGERVNNVDMRVAKIVRVKGTRANVGIDFYNLTNANTPTTVEADLLRSRRARRAVAAPDGGAAAAVRAVQRAVRFLMTKGPMPRASGPAAAMAPVPLSRLRGLQPQLAHHRLAHDELLRLAGDGDRQLVDEADVARHLVVRDLVAAEVADLVVRAAWPGLRMIHAATSSPYCASGTPKTCTAATFGWRNRNSSTSRG